MKAPDNRLTDSPPIVVEEHESRIAVARIAMALPPIERAYAMVRFTILRQKLLAVLNLLLPESGRILDVGCGFGLFSAYFSLVAPGRSIVGVDLSEKRVQIARNVKEQLGLVNNEYLCGTVDATNPTGPFDGIFMLDVLHHVHPAEQRQLLERLRGLLSPRGVLIIKDVTTDSPFKLRFTEVLDRVMVGPWAPLAYRHHKEWVEELRSLDLSVRVVRVPDILPYPHVVFVARPRES
jgi:2-polyprenyl-3-methyl-5-hydroxy-6-metoxy-1,4-benzoquinol methylase